MIIYVDPGSGSYLLQLAAAGLLGASFTLRTQLRRVAGWLHSRVRRARGGRGR